jgi:hypothetical protein
MITTGRGAVSVAGSPSGLVFEQVTPWRSINSCQLSALPPVAQTAGSSKPSRRADDPDRRPQVDQVKSVV